MTYFMIGYMWVLAGGMFYILLDLLDEQSYKERPTRQLDILVSIFWPIAFPILFLVELGRRFWPR